MNTRDCWFCEDAARTDPPVCGWLYEDARWRAGHAPAPYARAGTVIVESRRHVVDQSQMNAAERSTLATVTGRLIAAITAATGCDRVYQWATMDAYPHFHSWLVPWTAAEPLRGPRYLVDSIVEKAGCPVREAHEAAVRIRADLEIRR